MSVARGFGLNGKSLYTNVAKPQQVYASFAVDSANANGLGVSSLKSNGYVESVFMHTSQTPGKVNGYTNPNPAVGYALVRFKNNFNYWLTASTMQSLPTTSNTTTSTTAHSVFVITALGTASLAQWQAVGLPAGLTPAVGQAFVATATQSIGGSATVGVPGVAVAPIVTVIGNPTTTISNSNISVNAGAQLVLQFSKLTVSGTVAAPVLTMNSYTPEGTNDGSTPPLFTGTAATLTGTNSAPAFSNTSAYVAAAPTDLTVVSLKFCYDGSSVTIDGL